MKKTAFYIILLALTGMMTSLCSCSNDNDVDYTPKETLKLQNYDLLFDCYASQGSVSVQASGPVTAVAEQPWCTATVSGNTVNVSVTDNNSAEGRSCKITIKADGKDVVAIAQQKGLVFVANNGDIYEVNAAAEDHVIDIAYSGNKDMSVEPSDVDWAEFYMKDGKLHAKLKLNSDKNMRQTEAKIKAGDATSKITIRQGGLFFIVNDGKDFIVNDDAVSTNLSVETPQGITYTVAPSAADWAKFSIVDGKLHVDLAENTSGKPRQTEAIITYAGELTTKFSIQQADFDKDILGTYTLQYGSGSTRTVKMERGEEGQFLWRFLDGGIGDLGTTIPVYIDQSTNTMTVYSNVDLNATYEKNGITYKLTTRILYQNSAGSLYSKNSDKLAMIGTLDVDKDGKCTWSFVVNDQVTSTYKLYGLRIGYGTGGYTGWVGSYTTFANPVLVKE